MKPNDQDVWPLLHVALQQLQSAIELLDRCSAPGQIAAHVDLAANQLQDILSVARPEASQWQGSDTDRQVTSSSRQSRPN